jgi:hypothetical protein
MNIRRFGAFVSALGLIIFVGQVAMATENPFSQFSGNWTGSGTITVQDGTRERIRCRGIYTLGQSSDTIKLDLRCASDSFKFELQSDITYDNGNILGNWIEANRSVRGALSGKSTDNQIHAIVQTIGFTASLSLTTRGNNQNVSIKSPGSEVTEVAIKLARAAR